MYIDFSPCLEFSNICETTHRIVPINKSVTNNSSVCFLSTFYNHYLPLLSYWILWPNWYFTTRQGFRVSCWIQTHFAASGIEVQLISEFPCPATEPSMYRTCRQLMICKRGWTMATNYVLASNRTGLENTFNESIRVSNVFPFASVSNLSSWLSLFYPTVFVYNFFISARPSNLADVCILRCDVNCLNHRLLAFQRF